LLRAIPQNRLEVRAQDVKHFIVLRWQACYNAAGELVSRRKRFRWSSAARTRRGWRFPYCCVIMLPNTTGEVFARSGRYCQDGQRVLACQP
jgi:hypothetical protein